MMPFIDGLEIAAVVGEIILEAIKSGDTARLVSSIETIASAAEGNIGPRLRIVAKAIGYYVTKLHAPTDLPLEGNTSQPNPGPNPPPEK